MKQTNAEQKKGCGKKFEEIDKYHNKRYSFIYGSEINNHLILCSECKKKEVLKWNKQTQNLKLWKKKNFILKIGF